MALPTVTPTSDVSISDLPDVLTSSNETMTFADTLTAMSKEELVALADKEFGLDVDGRLSEDNIRTELVRMDQGRRVAAKDDTTTAARTVSSNVDPMVTIMFFNNEFRDAKLTFSNPGKRGLYSKANNKAGIKGKIPTFILFPGETYDLPLSIIRLLESRTFRTGATVYDKLTGQVKGNRPIVKPRFICKIILSDAQMQELSKIQKGA